MFLQLIYIKFLNFIYGLENFLSVNDSNINVEKFVEIVICVTLP
jgi:hypothetical protein